MKNNQCENTHPMLPINDSCVGNIKSIIVGDKDLIIQDLKDVIVSLNTSNKIIKSYYDKLFDEHLALRTSIYDVDIDDINEIILGANKTVNQNYILSMENISLKATIDKNKEEIKHLKHINSQLSKKINRQLNTINKFSSEIKEFNKWK